jgi:DEAD/DEAH box helicase domain-containing protein
MNPILLGRQVRDGLRDLVASSFDTSSTAFEGTVARFLSRPENFIKGPWLSVYMPFRPAVSAEEPFADVPLGFRPYRHQERAFHRLKSPGAQSTLVATGTGSGKTECYLWPILNACRASVGTPGIKAIIIYPMNALAADQARRIAKAIAKIPALAGVRCGLYADAEPENPTSEMTEQEVITSRSSMRREPPDILLTNYKMLDYLLLRGQDKDLWARNGRETLRYLVVDELHTFDGAQGADLALLIRRLKARLGTPGGHLACVGSSATLGAGEDAARRLLAYASDLFGEAFDESAVIREDRLSPREHLKPVDYAELPPADKIADAVLAAVDDDQGNAALRLAAVFFSDLDPTSERFDQTLPADPNTAEWRIALGARLLQHLAVHRILEALSEIGGAATVEQIVDRLRATNLFRGWAPLDLGAVIEALVALIAWARSGPATRPSALLNVRLQIWAREMGRMVATMPRVSGDGARLGAELLHSDDLDELALRRTLPVVHCRHCGTTGHLGRISERGGSVWAPLTTLYNEFFDGSQRLRLLFHEPVSRQRGKGYGAVIPGRINSTTLAFRATLSGGEDDGSETVPVFMYDPCAQDGRVDKTCPACGTAHALQILGLRAARLTASLVNSLFNSEHHEAEAVAKPRVLMFSDSVQDAAQRAAVAEIRNTGTVFRKALYRGLAADAKGLTLAGAIQNLPHLLRSQSSEGAFVANFIARDQAWRDDYQSLCRTGVIPSGSRLPDDIEKRLGWEFFSDLTYRAHTSQTLEMARLATADVEPEAVAAIAERLPDALLANLGPEFNIDGPSSHALLDGFLRQMRRRGAVAHTYVEMATESAGNRGPSFFAARAKLGMNVTQVLPVPNFRRSAAPMPVTVRSNLEGFDNLLSAAPTNWYAHWLRRFFDRGNVLAESRYGDIFRELLRTCENEGVVKKVEMPGAHGATAYLLAPDRIRVSTKVGVLACGSCGRRETVLAASTLPSSPCYRAGCPGIIHRVPDGEVSPSQYLLGLFRTDRNHRVVAREHTGILEPDDRRALERGFIDQEDPWAPNLVSATPTLEMGIDIGDLSTMLLCTVPPEEANYVQRIGRTGRRDGNSLNLTIAAARAHDLQFWEDPTSMLAGEVGAPGVHLEAAAVLKRQAAAFSLDRLIADAAQPVAYGKVKDVLLALERVDHKAFPLSWFAFLDARGKDLAEAFLELLPEPIRSRTQIADEIKAYLTGTHDKSLRWVVRAAFDDALDERNSLLELQKDIDLQRDRLRRLSPAPLDLDEQREALKRDRTEITRSIRDGINNVQVLQFLTDRGILPNYAFPEEGVKLKSIIVKRNELGKRKDDDDNGTSSLLIKEFMRPASTALSELAPAQTFYADGREVRIDRIDLRAKDLSEWRFCPSCSHTELEVTARAHPTCPKCRSPMWADGQSKSEAVELRTVIATTKESEATIKDSDDRQIRHYDRQIFPAYERDAILTAYATAPGIDAAPFGYEFISQCEFRDVNFGRKIDTPAGKTIAGEPRHSVPFRICRKCGCLQEGVREEEEKGTHQTRCEVPKRDLARDAWEAAIYLMRRFATEAIRVVVPVVGRAEHDEIKSFVAGLELGMKRHFAGKVDHIRSAVIEERIDGDATVRSLYLYDSVPGGSGYLRQMAEDPRTMQSIFRRAATALRDCGCVAQGRDGCFRCVRSYRNLFGPGEPKRDTALRLIEAALANWEHLRQVDSTVNEAIGASVVESVLEARFLESLRERFGAAALKPAILDTGRRGFQLTLPSPRGPVHWSVEPQVNIERRFPDMPTKRVDFLLTPRGLRDVKPIVVELDGWEFHAGSVADDMETRLRMIRSKRVEVWSLNWADFESDPQIKAANPFADMRLGPEAEGALANLWTAAPFAAFHGERENVKKLRNGRSLQLLQEALAKPARGHLTAAAILLRMAMGRGATWAEVPGIGALNTDGRTFLAEAPCAGKFTEAGLNVFVGAPNGPPNMVFSDPDGFRLVLQADIPALLSADHGRDARPAWAGLWRLVNLLQSLPGLHVIMPGLEHLTTPDTEAADADDPLWTEAAEFVDEALRDFLTAVRSAGVPPPDMIGEDLMSGDVIVGMVEAGWRERRIGVVLNTITHEDWRTFVVDPGDPPSIRVAIEAIVAEFGVEA